MSSHGSSPPALHHIEVWVVDLPAAAPRWHWLLTHLGWRSGRDWGVGREWVAADGTYLVCEQSADVLPTTHERIRPGVNHLAFTAVSTAVVDDLAANSAEHGWTLLFADRHPYAGGPNHYAAFLEDDDGFEVEIVGPRPDRD